MAGDADSYTITANLYKVSGGAETLLGTETTGALSVATTAKFTTPFQIPVTNQLIKKGDNLRLNLILSVTEQGTGGGTAYLYHDPETASADGHATTIKVPFRIDT
jgi:hypothetical protein